MAYSIYASIETIDNHFKMGKIIRGNNHQQYPNHVIVAYCQCWTQTYMPGKLIEVHQSIVLDWIIHNLDPPVSAPTVPHNNVFYTYSTKAAIVDHRMNGKIISSYYHPQYTKHVIVAYCQANKMLGLVAMHVDIGVDEQ